MRREQLFLPDEDCIRIPLPCGRVAIIDAADLHLVQGLRWRSYCARKSRTVYAVSGSSRTGRIFMHRRILGMPRGSEKTDHRNGDGLDNRRSNLRPATHAQNMKNRRLNANSSSGAKGVSWDASRGKWRAKITVDGKVIQLGRFATVEEASAVYQAAALKGHGDFCRLQ